eukprot:Phypoly_transcript_11373.p1 GENE.Phypoly_transcript_11373~~Phypoly_transcript_11373.p1  ORF type:complete len:309 (+),score=46.27 Phypoly_transcript_11373:72-998(+)
MPEKDNEIDFEFKVLLLGDSGVGKTSLMKRFTDGIFANPNAFGHVDCQEYYSDKVISIDDKTVRLEIWDTRGQEKFRALNASFYRNTNIVFLVFPLSKSIYETRATTLAQMENWWHELDRFNPENDEEPQVRVLVGSKIDIYPPLAETNEKLKGDFASPSSDPLSGLSSLPSIAVHNILSFLPVSELCKCNLLSTHWYRVVEDDALWHKLVLLRFPQVSSHTFPTWKQEYKDAIYEGVRLSDLEEMGKKYSMRTHITSAKTGTNVSAMFEDAAKHLIPAAIKLAKSTPKETKGNSKEKPKGFFRKLFK